MLSLQEMLESTPVPKQAVCCTFLHPLPSRRLHNSCVANQGKPAWVDMQVGALVWCFVRRIESYGVLLGIDNTRISGLLHISAISRAHVEDPWVSAWGPCSLSTMLA